MTPLVRDGRPVALLVHRADLLDDPELVEEVAPPLASRSRTSACRPKRARSSRSCARRAHASSRPATTSAAGSSAISTTAPSSGSSCSRSHCDSCGASSTAHEEQLARLDAAETQLREALTELRELAHGIYPAVLGDEGLATAIEALAEDGAGADRASPCRRSGSRRRSRPPRIWSSPKPRRAAPSPCAVARRDGALVVDIEAEAEPEGLVDLEDRIGALDGRSGSSMPRRRSQNPRGDPMRIVVADDSMLLREGLARLLADAGFEVVGKARTRPSSCARRAHPP